MAQNRTIGMAAFRSAAFASSPFRCDIRHHGEHRGAMWIISGFCSKIQAIALDCPTLVLRSKPVLRSTGEPVRKPRRAEH